MRARAVTSTIAIAGIATVLAGCSFIQSFTLQEFEVGQCLNTSGTVEETEAEAGYFPVVDCTEEHDAEVYAVYDTALTDFDETAIQDEAEQTCYNAFESYVGVAYDDSELYYSFVYPSSDTWGDDDRQVACLLIASEYTESLKGSGL